MGRLLLFLIILSLVAFSFLSAELRVARSNGSRGSVACRSACEAFGDPRFCCSEAYSTPDMCGPSPYSLFFKHACPRAYSYAYDDKTSTYTCANANYLIIFCPFPYTRYTYNYSFTFIHP
ncbi:Thaumatin-like protein [Glycine soja]|nr:Thaumatin-like protein [Glycine soja]